MKIDDSLCAPEPVSLALYLLSMLELITQLELCPTSADAIMRALPSDTLVSLGLTPSLDSRDRRNAIPSLILQLSQQPKDHILDP